MPMRRAMVTVPQYGHARRIRSIATQSATHLPSLVICTPSLASHVVPEATMEEKKFIAATRTRERDAMNAVRLVIAPAEPNAIPCMPALAFWESLCSKSHSETTPGAPVAPE